MVSSLLLLKHALMFIGCICVKLVLSRLEQGMLSEMILGSFQIKY